MVQLLPNHPWCRQYRLLHNEYRSHRCGTSSFLGIHGHHLFLPTYLKPRWQAYYTIIYAFCPWWFFSDACSCLLKDLLSRRAHGSTLLLYKVALACYYLWEKLCQFLYIFLAQYQRAKHRFNTKIKMGIKIISLQILTLQPYWRLVTDKKRQF